MTSVVVPEREISTHAVIATREAVLGGGIRVGGALPQLLAAGGIRLAHEPRRPAPDRRDALARAGEVARDVVEAPDDTLPVVRLGGDLLGEVGRVRHGGSRRLEGGRRTPEEV